MFRKLVPVAVAAAALGAAAQPAAADDQPVTPPVPLGQALYPETVPSDVAGVQFTLHRHVRGHGVVALGGTVGASFLLDLRKAPSTKLEYRAPGVYFHSLRLTQIRIGVDAAQIRGIGIAHGLRTRFTAVLVDHGARGDIFRLAWGGGASRGGTVVRGDVTIT